jgi:diacylglycerol kinase
MKKTNKTKGYTIKKQIRSFGHAFTGMGYAIRTQRNMQIHLLAVVAVVAAAFYFSISLSEWMAVLICIGLVLAAESFNTAIELLADKIWPGYDKQAGRVKDIAAAAVLFCAIISLFVASLIFVPKIITIL